MSMEEEIKHEFEKNGFTLDDEQETLRKCLAFCINYKITPSDLLSSWEIYFLNRHFDGSRVQDEQIEGFLSHLQNEQKESILKEESNLHFYSSSDVDVLLGDKPEDSEVFLGTPISASERQYFDESNLLNDTSEKPSADNSSADVSNYMTPFGQRVKKFTIQVTINASDTDKYGEKNVSNNSENDVIKRIRPSNLCSLQCLQSKPEVNCRFMYDRVADRFDSLESRIKRYTSALVASQLYGKPTDATLASQDKIFSVGMVCCDGEGHLNEKSILLQCSVDVSGGQRVRLDLQNLDQFSLFPGQVIGIEGHNPSGHCLIAGKVIDSIPFCDNINTVLPRTKRQAMDLELHSNSGTVSQELSLIIAAGPFTTTDNLLFEPLVELLSYSSRRQPELLILLGPFVDSEHPQLKNGTIDKSFDEIFHKICRKLQDYALMDSNTRVILMPSTRDAHHDYVFPQPAFEIYTSEDLQHRMTSIANPGCFSANEVAVGCCTVDILKQLSSEEISRMPGKGLSNDRMGRLASHIVKQCSFYPLYPPAVTVPLDFSLSPEALLIQSTPDILILPSDLAPFIKILTLGEETDVSCRRCLCVNPGRLAKGVSGGTFAELDYHQDPRNTNGSIIRI